ncbi:MAG: uroporphyrinogen decarboxylase family protein [bacterium]
MNSYERYMAAARGEPCDFLPRLPILMQYAAEHIGSNYGAFASDYRVLTEANLHCCEEFGIDQLNTMSDPYRETQGYGAEMIYSRDTVPRCKKHPLEDSKDLSALPRPNPLMAERMLDRVNAVRAYKQRAWGLYSIMGWVEGPAAEAADLRTVQQFMMDLIDEEQFIGELMDICVEVAIDFARVQVEAGADTIGIGDAVASMVSPAIYMDLIQPREKRLVRALHDMGAVARMHICGNITHLLPGLADVKPDIIDVDWMVDLRKVREMMDKNTVICANLDPVRAVHNSNPVAIRQAVRGCYRAVGNPFMVNAGCEIPHGTPVKNLKALCEPLEYNGTAKLASGMPGR